MDQQQASVNETEEQKDIRLNKDMAAFSYVWIMSVPIFFTKKQSKFVQFHSKQGLVLFLMTIPVSFLPFLSSLLMFVLVAGMVLGFLNAANGVYKDVPLAGKLSRGEITFEEMGTQILGAMKKCVQLIKKAFKSDMMDK